MIKVEEMVQSVISDINAGRECDVKSKVSHSIRNIISQQETIAQAESKIADERLKLKAIEEAIEVNAAKVIGA